MDFKALMFWIVSTLCVVESVIVKTQLRRPARRLISRRKGMPYRAPAHQAGAKTPPKSLTQNLEIRNLPLAPGETKVIRQTLVVRRRPNGQRGSGQRSKPAGRHPVPLVMIKPTHAVGTQMPQHTFGGGHGNHPVGGQGHSNPSLATLNLPVINIDQHGHILSTSGISLSGPHIGAGSHASVNHQSPAHATPINGLATVDVIIADPAPTSHGRVDTSGHGHGMSGSLGHGHSGGGAFSNLFSLGHPPSSSSGQRFVRVGSGNGHHFVFAPQASSVHTTVRTKRMSQSQGLMEDLPETSLFNKLRVAQGLEPEV